MNDFSITNHLVKLLLFVVIFSFFSIMVFADVNQDLIKYSEQGDYNKVLEALNNGAEIDTRDKNGKTSLILASFEGHKNIVKLLLKKGADVNATNDSGRTALMAACFKVYPDIVNLLLNYGADVNQKNNDSVNAFMTACYTGNIRIVKLLLSYGADVNSRTEEDETALMLASMQGHTDIVRLLIKEGADVNIKSSSNLTALKVAFFFNHNNIVKYLLRKGADRKDLISVNRFWFWTCDYSDYCLDKMTISFENNSFSHISKLYILFTVKDKDGYILYRKKHWIKIDLDHGEVGRSKPFSLDDKVISNYDFNEEDTHTFEVKVLSFKR